MASVPLMVIDTKSHRGGFVSADFIKFFEINCVAEQANDNKTFGHA
jgi:hypothetical protein